MSDAWNLNNGRKKRVVTFSYPLTYAASKNRRLNMGKNYKVYVTKDIRALEDFIIDVIQKQNVPFYDGPVQLDIKVYKHTARFDPINVLDTLADAVKKAIDVDDQWYSASITYDFDSENPRVAVVISQRIKEHHRWCKECNVVQPLVNFKKEASAGKTMRGYGSKCLPCHSAYQKRRYARSKKRAADS